MSVVNKDKLIQASALSSSSSTKKMLSGDSGSPILDENNKVIGIGAWTIKTGLTKNIQDEDSRIISNFYIENEWTYRLMRFYKSLDNVLPDRFACFIDGYIFEKYSNVFNQERRVTDTEVSEKMKKNNVKFGNNCVPIDNYTYPWIIKIMDNNKTTDRLEN